MNPTDAHNNNINYNIPFKSDNNVIKSEWKSTLCQRRQVRILIEPTGEFSVQTVAQNSIANLTSSLLKSASCGRVKSFGKAVESIDKAVFTLPTNLAVPLSEEKQKAALDLQSGTLSLSFLSSCNRLNNLGSELLNYTINNSQEQAAMRKAFDMNQAILNYQLELTSQFPNEITAEDLYKKFQEFKEQTNILCELYPIQLKEYIDALKKAKADALIQEQERVQEQVNEPVISNI